MLFGYDWVLMPGKGSVFAPSQSASYHSPKRVMQYTAADRKGEMPGTHAPGISGFDEFYLWRRSSVGGTEKEARRPLAVNPASGEAPAPRARIVPVIEYVGIGPAIDSWPRPGNRAKWITSEPFQ